MHQIKSPKNHQRKRILFISAIFLISLISLIFIIINFQDNIVFFYAPSEAHKISNDKILVRVGGMIKKGSIIKTDATNTKFIITDYQQELLIFYQGILPDLFREEQGVVARGHYYSKENIFIANELLVKHDENYMPPEITSNLKMRVPNKY